MSLVNVDYPEPLSNQHTKRHFVSIDPSWSPFCERRNHFHPIYPAEQFIVNQHWDYLNVGSGPGASAFHFNSSFNPLLDQTLNDNETLRGEIWPGVSWRTPSRISASCCCRLPTSVDLQLDINWPSGESQVRMDGNQGSYQRGFQ